MSTLIKLGIAVACLIGVAAFIAIDMATSKRNPEPVAAVAPEIIPPAVVPVITSAPAAPAVICPSPAAPETVVKKAEPAPAASTPAPTPPVQPEALKQYTVLQGDTLYGISVKVYGTPRHYEKIFEANRDRISDPNTLQIGINLRMPALPKAEPVGVVPPAGASELGSAD